MIFFFNKQELLQKAIDRYHDWGGKEKPGEYYLANKDVLKEKAKNKYKSLSKEGKEVKRKYSRHNYKNMKEKASQISIKQ